MGGSENHKHESDIMTTRDGRTHAIDGNYAREMKEGKTATVWLVGREKEKSDSQIVHEVGDKLNAVERQ